MPKYILRKGEREQAFQGIKLEARACCNVTVRDSIMFYNGIVVDTGDLSMQSWVDIGMLEEVKEEADSNELVSGYVIMEDAAEPEKNDPVLDDDTVQVVDKQEDITETETKVFVEENKEPDVKSSDIVVEDPIHEKELEVVDKPIRRYGRKGK